MRFKCHIDGSSTCRFGDIGGQNLTPDSRAARNPRGSLPLPRGEGRPPRGKGGRVYIGRAVLPPVSLLPTTLIEKRIIRYSKIVIFQSFLLRFGRGFRRFSSRKLFYNVVVSSRKELRRR